MKRSLLLALAVLACAALIPAAANAAPGPKAAKLLNRTARNGQLTTLAYEPFTTMSGSVVQPWQLRKTRWSDLRCFEFTCTALVTVTNKAGGLESAQLVRRVGIETFGKPSFTSVR